MGKSKLKTVTFYTRYITFSFQTITNSCFNKLEVLWYHTGNSWQFLKSHILNKFFLQSSHQS